MHRSIAHLLEERAAQHPERNFIGERTPLRAASSGDWRFITYGEANARAIGGRAGAARPRAGARYAADDPVRQFHLPRVMMLGAMKARVPVAPVSVAYSLMSSDHGKLRHVFEIARPKMVFAEQGPIYARALAALAARWRRGRDRDADPGSRDDIVRRTARTNAGPDVAASMDKIDHGTVAKYLFTSGSTGMPKGVIQTHRHDVCGGRGAEALRTEEPDPNEIPQSLEWMPWNHISAGNIGFNGNLNAGGTVYLDAGKPLPGMFDETIRNLREISPLGSAPRRSRSAGWPTPWSAKRNCATGFSPRCRYVGYGGATLSPGHL